MQYFIDMNADEWATLKAHLLRSDVEEAAVGFADVVVTELVTIFRVERVRALHEDEFAIQTAYHISLTDECRGSVIKEAWDSGKALLEFHSHIDQDHEARFSPSDLAGFKEFVPHVFWRLRGKPYAAVVISPKGVDAVAWITSPTTPVPVSAIRIPTEIYPTGKTFLTRGFNAA